MFNKYTNGRIRDLFVETGGLRLDLDKQMRMIEDVRRSQEVILENQKILSGMLKQLADCFQLEYVEGRYISKKKLRKSLKRNSERK